MSLLKYKYILIVFLIGCIGFIFGTLQKILHTPYANNIIKIGVYTMITAMILAIIKLIFNQKKNDILNQ